MAKRGELDSSGFFTTSKDVGLDSKSSLNKQKSGRKHPELKLWIYDLLTITKENDEQFYNFRGLSVNIVNIYGVVTEVATNRFGVLYKVDDGTGNIGCWHDYRKIVQKEQLEDRLNKVMSAILDKDTDPAVASTSVFPDPEDSIAPQKSDIIKAAQWFERRIRDFTETRQNTLFVLGDTVNLRGKLADFRGERCIRIYNIQLVKNINEETDRRFELIHLYETFYSKLGNQ